VTANAGEIELVSEEGVGTTVRVQLQAADPEIRTSEAFTESTAAMLEVAVLERPPPLVAEELDSAADSETSRVARVLVIEDNPDLCRHVEQVLGGDFSCQFAHDGETGLELGIETVPDVVICDVMLPKMNGFEVARQLKQDDRTCHIPVVLLTARADEESRVLGLRSLADDYVTKPFSESELRERVERLLAVREILRQRYSQYANAASVEAASAALSARDRRFIERAEHALEKHHSDADLSLAQLASLLAMSERQLQRKLKAVTNVTPREYVRNFRLAKALHMLETGERASDVAFAVGFTSQSYFTSCFKARFGVTPTEVRLRADRQRPEPS